MALSTASKDTIKAKRKELREEKTRLQAEIAARTSTIDVLQAEKVTMTARVQEIDAALVALTADLPEVTD